MIFRLSFRHSLLLCSFKIYERNHFIIINGGKSSTFVAIEADVFMKSSLAATVYFQAYFSRN